MCCFDQDPLGAILHFVHLMRHDDHAARQRWKDDNAHSEWHQLWIGIAASKSHLLEALRVGRQESDVRRTIDRIFRLAETHNLIASLPTDDNLSTTYRVLTPLGEELLHQNAHREYVGGLRTVVHRWRNSVVKIASSAKSVGPFRLG